MTSSLRGSALITSAPSRVGAVRHADRFVQPGFDPRRTQPGESPEPTTLNRADDSLPVTAKRPARILLVDTAATLHESHLLLLQSIPAIVETLPSCAEMYFHEKDGYVLVILALPPKSREIAKAADFVRRRWSTAKILLLKGETAMIDDWLYDDRIDPHLHPATVREAAIRLMPEDK